MVRNNAGDSIYELIVAESKVYLNNCREGLILLKNGRFITSSNFKKFNFDPGVVHGYALSKRKVASLSISEVKLEFSNLKWKSTNNPEVFSRINSKMSGYSVTQIISSLPNYRDNFPAIRYCIDSKVGDKSGYLPDLNELNEFIENLKFNIGSMAKVLLNAGLDELRKELCNRAINQYNVIYIASSTLMGSGVDGIRYWDLTVMVHSAIPYLSNAYGNSVMGLDSKLNIIPFYRF